ncbi:hypothetical protein [Burkholderia multivorans]|uniref:hypothetical protein n=1 Tax=Burkholderia multivorans TaxID=87883 RepID=UPI0020199B3A|nr:hypothetical protein [Burkholderia multivorans]MCO1384477.1 hypothetical protein [Burkholderia multivorans]MCO1399885.1 hypothetical protein [Burkholderia multivorans]UQO81056.1 hypothetical protein L0Z12_21675 [Burkholderia multivorans]
MANVFSITITAVDRATAVAQKVNRSIAQITKPIADVRASVSAFSKETGMDKLGRSIQKVGIFATESARRVASIAPPLAALTSIGTIAGVAALAHSWGRNAIQIRNTASVIGISTTQLQEYQGAARLAGLSSDAMTDGLKAVGSAFEDASAGRDTFVAGVLADKGIGIHRLQSGAIDTVRALHDVADAASKITNAQAREKFLDIFGLGGLSPMLARGGAALDAYVAKFRSLNAVMSPAQIAQGERYNEAMVALDASVDKLKNSVGASLAPALARVADRLAPIADKYGPKIAQWIETTDWEGKAKSIGSYVDALGGVKAVAAAIAAITFAGPLASIVKLVAQATKLVGLLGTIALTTGPGGAAAVAAGGLIAERSRASALDRSIHRQSGETESQRDQRVAEAIAGGVVTPDAGHTRAGAWTGWNRWWSNLFGGSDKGTPTEQPSQPQSNAGKPPLVGQTPVAQPSQAIANPASAAGARVPLGIRNNNPLNMTANGQERVYTTPEEGIADAVANLQRNYQGLTIAQIQDKWTGGTRTGNTPEQIANYTRLMTQATGLTANAVPDLSDPRVVSSLVSGMIRAENGQMPYTAPQIGAATLLGMQRAGVPRPADDARFAATSSAPQAQGVDAGGGLKVASIGGKVEVNVRFANAPKGMTASVKTHGNVVASTNIGRSGLLGASV